METRESLVCREFTKINCTFFYEKLEERTIFITIFLLFIQSISLFLIG